MMLPHWAILAATKISTSETGSDTEVRISGEAKNINSFANILNTVYFWAGVVAVIVIIVAGFYYTLSQDNSQQVSRAKNAILGATIGLVVIFVAYAITTIVIEAVG